MTTLREDFLEIRRLLAEAYEHYFTYSDGYCKSSEGAISLHYPEYYWREGDQSKTFEPKVEIYSYVFGSGRSHWFDSMAEALVEIRKWHADEMTSQYCPSCEAAQPCWCDEERE